MSEFATQCLELSASILEHALAGNKSPIISAGPQIYAFSPAPKDSSLPASGSIDELSDWLRRHVTRYDARQELTRIAYDGTGFCVITACPRARLRASNFLGAGRVSLLLTYVWQQTDGTPQLIHTHLSLIGLTLETAEPYGENMLVRIPVSPTDSHTSIPGGFVSPRASRGQSRDAKTSNASAPSSDAKTDVVASDTLGSPDTLSSLVSPGSPDTPGSSVTSGSPDSSDTPDGAPAGATALDLPSSTYVMLRDTEGNVYYTDARQIIYLEADRNYTIVHGKTTAARFRVGLSAKMEVMPDFFLRVHRSFAVNALEVKTMTGSEIVLTNGDKIPVSGRSRARVREELHAVQARWASKPGDTPPRLIRTNRRG